MMDDEWVCVARPVIFEYDSEEEMEKARRAFLAEAATGRHEEEATEEWPLRELVAVTTLLVTLRLVHMLAQRHFRSM